MNCEKYIFWSHPSPHTGQSVDPMPWSSLIERMLLPCLMMVNDPWLQILHSSWPKLIDYDRISHQVWMWWSRHMEESSLSSRFEFPPYPHFHIRWSDPFLLPPMFLLVCSCTIEILSFANLMFVFMWKFRLLVLSTYLVLRYLSM